MFETSFAAQNTILNSIVRKGKSEWRAANNVIFVLRLRAANSTPRYGFGLFRFWDAIWGSQNFPDGAQTVQPNQNKQAKEGSGYHA